MSSSPRQAPETRQEILRSLDKLQGWLERNHYTGYEPFDGLATYLRPLTLGTKLGRQILVQLVKRFPVNVRPILGIKRATSTKGMGFLARGYLRWEQIESSNGFQKHSEDCLDWLSNHRSRGFSGSCWGNHFDYQTRLFYVPAESPTVVWSSLIGQAFIDAFEKYRKQAYLDEAVSISRFITLDLPRFTDRHGTCISYVPHVNVQVHNANSLAAGFLARVYWHTNEPELKEIARQALAYTAGHQNPDGSWYYGSAANLRWIDNWHTAYVLDSYLDYRQATDDHRFDQTCEFGLQFYLKNFFESFK